jgi:hypothetical protein
VSDQQFVLYFFIFVVYSDLHRRRCDGEVDQLHVFVSVLRHDSFDYHEADCADFVEVDEELAVRHDSILSEQSDGLEGPGLAPQLPDWVYTVVVGVLDEADGTKGGLQQLYLWLDPVIAGQSE